MALTLTLDSAFLVLTLRGKSFTLTAPHASATIGEETSSTPSSGVTRKTKRQRVNWTYHASYDEAFDLGSLSDAEAVITEIGAMLPALPAVTPSGPSVPAGTELINQWNSAKQMVSQLPVLGTVAQNVLDTIENTSVKITDLGVALDLTTVTETQGSAPATSANVKITGNGALTVGLAFTPSPAKPIRLFALGITAFGAVLSVKLDHLDIDSATGTFKFTG